MSGNMDKPGRMPMVLSAFVYPGLGQLVQRRWLAGFLFLVTFTICFVMLAINVIVPLFKTLNAVMAFANDGSNEKFGGISPLGILVPFVLSIVIYIANVVDVSRAIQSRRLHPPPLPFS